MKAIFTISDVARICKVSERTATKWFDSGRLRGCRVPGSMEPKVPREHLIRFLKEHGMPLGDLDAPEMKTLLLLGLPDDFEAALVQCLDEDKVRIEIAASGFAAGINIESRMPDCVLIDFSMIGSEAAFVIAQHLYRDERYFEIPLIAVVDEEQQDEGFNWGVFHEVLQRPVDTHLVAAKIQTVLDVQEVTAE